MCFKGHTMCVELLIHWQKVCQIWPALLLVNLYMAAAAAAATAFRASEALLKSFQWFADGELVSLNLFHNSISVIRLIVCSCFELFFCLSRIASGSSVACLFLFFGHHLCILAYGSNNRRTHKHTRNKWECIFLQWRQTFWPTQLSPTELHCFRLVTWFASTGDQAALVGQCPSVLLSGYGFFWGGKAKMLTFFFSRQRLFSIWHKSWGMIWRYLWHVAHPSNLLLQHLVLCPQFLLFLLLLHEVFLVDFSLKMNNNNHETFGQGYLFWLLMLKLWPKNATVE